MINMFEISEEDIRTAVETGSTFVGVWAPTDTDLYLTTELPSPKKKCVKAIAILDRLRHGYMPELNYRPVYQEILEALEELTGEKPSVPNNSNEDAV